MAEGWTCPHCQLVLAPHVAQHRCDPPATGTMTTVAPQPSGPWSGTVTVTSVTDGQIAYQAQGSALTVAGPYWGNEAGTPRHLRSVGPAA